jgi:hypothetical protein
MRFTRRTSTMDKTDTFDVSQVEDEIELALQDCKPLRAQSPADYAMPSIRHRTPLPTTPLPPLPSYVEHKIGVDELGQVTAESVVAQYESAVTSLQEMGTTLIDCVHRAETMAAGCKSALAFIQDTAQQYRDESKLIFERIEQASLKTAEVRSVCEEMRAKLDHLVEPSPA